MPIPCSPTPNFTPNAYDRERKKREKAEGYQKKEREEAAARAAQEQKAAEEAAKAAEDAADAKKIRLREKKAMQKARSRLRSLCTDIGSPLPHCHLRPLLPFLKKMAGSNPLHQDSQRLAIAWYRLQQICGSFLFTILTVRIRNS